MTEFFLYPLHLPFQDGDVYSFIKAFAFGWVSDNWRGHNHDAFELWNDMNKFSEGIRESIFYQIVTKIYIKRSHPDKAFSYLFF